MARKPSKLPSTRTKAYFNNIGYTTQLVERFIPYANRRIDFLGCADVLAVKVGQPILAIQCFSSDWSGHKKKIIDGEEPWAKEGAILWLSLDNTEFWFVGFRKLKLKRGSAAYRWTPRFGRVTIADNGVDLVLTEIDNFKNWWE